MAVRADVVRSVIRFLFGACRFKFSRFAANLRVFPLFSRGFSFDFLFWPGVFDRSENTKTGCPDIWMLSGSSSAVVGLVLRLGRVPAPPSQLFKDAPDPTSQGIGNRTFLNH